MTTRLVILLFAITFGCSGLSAQAKVRIRVLDENDQPLKYIRLTLSGANLPIETQSNGEYTLEFPPGKAEIVFYPPNDYERISPPNGMLLLPEDKSRTIDIWLARKNSGNRALESYTRILSKKEAEKTRLKLENETLRARLSQIESDQQNTVALRDSIETMFRQNAGNTSALTREIADLQEALTLKQQLFYQKISGELIVYADRLKDLRDALPRVRDAFIDQRAMARFDKTIGAYNAARDSLLHNHRGHAEIVHALWGTTLAEGLSIVYEQALTEIHQQLVLPLNTSLLNLFRAVHVEEIRPAKARKKAEEVGNAAFEKLNATIPAFETNIRAALDNMEAALHLKH